MWNTVEVEAVAVYCECHRRTQRENLPLAFFFYFSHLLYTQIFSLSLYFLIYYWKNSRNSDPSSHSRFSSPSPLRTVRAFIHREETSTSAISSSTRVELIAPIIPTPRALSAMEREIPEALPKRSQTLISVRKWNWLEVLRCRRSGLERIGQYDSRTATANIRIARRGSRSLVSRSTSLLLYV